MIAKTFTPFFIFGIKVFAIKKVYARR